MNLLGHAALASDNPEALIGNLAGDLIKGRLENRFSPDLERGLRAHRQIDAFTDQHAVQDQIRLTLPKNLKRFAGIVSDIAFGQILALQWDEYMSLDFSTFKARIHQR